MESNTIERRMNDKDRDYIEVELSSKRKKNYLEQFTIELNKHEKVATVKGLPFARHAAKDDFTNEIQANKQNQLREFGEIREAIKVPKLDWKKYSDVKNFDIAKEEEVPDAHLEKRNPGLIIAVKKTEYRYKGYGNIYRVMESPQAAIKRAQEVIKKSRG